MALPLSSVRPSPSLPTEVVCTAKYKAAYPYRFADVQSSPPLALSFSSDVRPVRHYDTLPPRLVARPRRSVDVYVLNA